MEKIRDIENMSKDQIAMNLKYLLEEKAELERQIRVGEEAKRAITYTEDKLGRLMERYLGA